MPKYVLRLRRDAWLNFGAEIEAATPEEALAKAQASASARKGAPGWIDWEETGLSVFDACHYEVEDEDENTLVEGDTT